MNTIEHEGIVIKVSEADITIAIESQSACAACHAKGACGLSEVAQKQITAEKPSVPVAVGDRVIVTATTRNAMLSVLFAYVLPSVLIIILLAVLVFSGINEVVAASLVLFAVSLYFVLLYLFKNRFARTIKFKVKTISP